MKLHLVVMMEIAQIQMDVHQIHFHSNLVYHLGNNTQIILIDFITGYIEFSYLNEFIKSNDFIDSLIASSSKAFTMSSIFSNSEPFIKYNNE